MSDRPITWGLPQGGRELRAPLQQAATESEESISVVVHARDPISREGVIGQLRHHPVVAVVDEENAQAGDVAVLLMESFDEAGLSRLRRLARHDGLHVVLVVSLIREAELSEVFQCGVGAIIWRHEATGHRLLQAVLAASRGDADLPADVIGRLISQVGASRPGAVGQSNVSALGLAPREIDVLRLVADGLGTQEIASKMAYSVRTIKNIIQGLTTRLGLRNRTHAVAYALREGYIS